MRWAKTGYTRSVIPASQQLACSGKPRGPSRSGIAYGSPFKHRAAVSLLTQLRQFSAWHLASLLLPTHTASEKVGLRILFIRQNDRSL